MASFVARLTLALSFIALALAGYSLVQNTLSSPTHTRLNLIPTWLDSTFDSADVLSYLGFGKSSGRLSDSNCVFSAVKEIVDAAITAETRMGASLIRLHFHDCFVDIPSKLIIQYWKVLLFSFLGTTGTMTISIQLLSLMIGVINSERSENFGNQ